MSYNHLAASSAGVGAPQDANVKLATKQTRANNNFFIH